MKRIDFYMLTGRFLPDGRVSGVVRVHRCCGNDPVGEHIARSFMARLTTPAKRLTISLASSGTLFTYRGTNRHKPRECAAWIVIESHP
jgi:hypothetical protein